MIHFQDLIENTVAMFDCQLRTFLRDYSPRQSCSLRLPATETFSGVVIEVIGERCSRKHTPRLAFRALRLLLVHEEFGWYHPRMLHTLNLVLWLGGVASTVTVCVLYCSA